MKVSIDIDTPHELWCVRDTCKWTELSVTVKRGRGQGLDQPQVCYKI